MHDYTIPSPMTGSALLAGAAAETDFGLSVTGESGAWWIAGNLMRDAAALLRIELLPWDEWGVMPAAGSAIPRESAELFDRLAAATVGPDAARVAEVMAEPGLRVPPMVRNGPLGREEVV